MTAEVVRMHRVLAFNLTEAARLIGTSRDLLASRIGRVEPAGRRSGHALYTLESLLPALKGDPEVHDRCARLSLGLLAVHLEAVAEALMTSSRVPRIRELAMYTGGLVAGLGVAADDVPAELAERARADAAATALVIVDELAPVRERKRATSS